MVGETTAGALPTHPFPGAAGTKQPVGLQLLQRLGKTVTALRHSVTDNHRADGAQPLNQEAFTIDDFEIGHSLGKEKFWNVYLAPLKENHFTVALKVLLKSQRGEEELERRFRREAEIQAHLQHLNILCLYSYFRYARWVSLILEYAPWDKLCKELQRNHALEKQHTVMIMEELEDALTYRYEKKVIHRDLEPKTLLLELRVK